MLSDEQQRFLKTHNIPASLVFDATGMRTADYKRVMKRDGKCFAFGVSPCTAAGHELRTRAGHCVQCDTSKIAYMMRNDEAGQVYLAGSITGRVLKIGSTGGYLDRQHSLRNARYAGQGDWTIIAYVNCKRAGFSEGWVQNNLSRWSCSGDYIKGRVRQQCYELFVCSPDRALAALDALETKTSSPKSLVSPQKFLEYDFSRG